MLSRTAIGLWSKQEAGLYMQIRLWLALNQNTNVTSVECILFLSVLHGRVSLAAVNHIYVFHEVINGCKNLKIH